MKRLFNPYTGDMRYPSDIESDPEGLLIVKPGAPIKAAKTTAQRQRKFRQRKADTEATEVRGIFAHPDDHADIKAHAGKIARRRARIAKAGA